jgi:hypothetical protein
MPNYAVQVTIWPTSNLQADASTNTWSCVGDDAAAASDFTNSVLDFYKTLVTLYPNTVRQTDHTYKIYNRADPIPRVPVEEGTWSFTGAPTGTPLPPEVALCTSFQADPESGVSQARKRGRVYLGPLKDAGLGTDGRPSSSILTLIEGAAQTLLDESVAATNYYWSVYSAVASDSFEVSNGWIDNEYDTQRRRGRVPTTRNLFA